MSLATIVKGNTFSLAIPLQVYAVEDGEVVLRDYTPESGDNITIRLKGDRRNYTYTPSTNGSTAFIHLEGSEVVGVYAVEAEIVKDDDSKLTSMRFEQLSIVESIDELNEGQITEGIEQGAIYLDPEIFIAGKDGRGIVSIVKTATSGLVDTYTITYTDNTTSTFNVTNGKDGINGEDGVDGADGADGVGIASIAKTGTQGLVDTYTITLTNGTTYAYQVTNGKDGKDGENGRDGADGQDGVGIASITKTGTQGLVDTYTITLTNGTTTTFTVTNGSDATQVQSDWAQSDPSADDYIKNKPSLATVATSGSYNDLLNKPTVPAVGTLSTNNATTQTVPTSAESLSGAIKLHKVSKTGTYSDLIGTPSLAAVATSGDYGDLNNTPSLATVATSGSYNDLSNKPTIPTVNNATLTIQKNGTTVNSFTANASSNVTANITVPTKVSDLTNDSGFITSYTETDPVFLASAAASITSSDITAWNNKQNALTFDTAPTASSTNPVTSGGVKTALDAKQATLVSGTSIKTVNNTSLLGSGNVAVQPTLVSGTNIKTVNSTSLLGSGDVTINGSNVNYTGSTGNVITANTSVNTALAAIDTAIGNVETLLANI